MAAPYGRFAWSQFPKMPGWQLDGIGLQAMLPGASKLIFENPIRSTKLIDCQGYSAIYTVLSHGRSPSKMRCSLYGTGPELYFEAGLQLEINSEKAPILTWNEGSAGDGVPTPKTSWVILSFQDPQPPIVLSFPEAKAGLMIEGSPRHWRLVSADGLYRTWVRFSLPMGLHPMSTDNASDLGVLTEVVKAHADLWTEQTPKLIEGKVTRVKGGIEASWLFDHAGAVIPKAAVLAPGGGYPLKLVSQTIDAQAPTDEGPTIYSAESTVRIFFPLRPWPQGRIFTQQWTGPDFPDPNAPPVINDALRMLWADCTPDVSAQLKKEITDSTANAEVFYDNVTGQRWPWPKEGNEAMAAAAASALGEICLSRSKFSTKVNPWWTTVQWCTDSSTWTPAISDQALRRRLLSLTAVAGAVSIDPADWLRAACSEAALAAEDSLSGLDRKKEPLWEYRDQLFGDKSTSLGQFTLLQGPSVRAIPTPSGTRILWETNNKGLGSITIRTGAVWALKGVLGIKDPDLQPIKSGVVLNFNSLGQGNASASFSLSSGTAMILDKPIPVRWTAQ